MAEEPSARLWINAPPVCLPRYVMREFQAATPFRPGREGWSVYTFPAQRNWRPPPSIAAIPRPCGAGRPFTLAHRGYAICARHALRLPPPPSSFTSTANPVVPMHTSRTERAGHTGPSVGRLRRHTAAVVVPRNSIDINRKGTDLGSIRASAPPFSPPLVGHSYTVPASSSSTALVACFRLCPPGAVAACDFGRDGAAPLRRFVMTSSMSTSSP